jgi:ABC-type amino acid transport substrate-binding protein
VHGTWSQCLERLKKNEIDIMVDVAFSEERAREYNVTHETFLVNWAAVYAGRKQAIESLIDLSGKKIAVMQDSIHTDGEGGIKTLAPHSADSRCGPCHSPGYSILELPA